MTVRRWFLAAMLPLACAPQEVRIIEPDARVSVDRGESFSVDVPALDLPDAVVEMDLPAPQQDVIAVDAAAADAPTPVTDRVTVLDAPLLLDAPPDCGRELTTCCAGLTCLPGLRCVEERCVQDPTCGGLNRTCCRGTECDPGLRCAAGRCVGEACTPIGSPCAEGATCCAGRVCRPSPTNRVCCTEVDGPCTGPGECCGAATCMAGRCVNPR